MLPRQISAAVDVALPRRIGEVHHLLVLAGPRRPRAKPREIDHSPCAPMPARCAMA
jgi:hypothetical protein